MNKVLVIIGGILNTLFGLFHIWLARAIHLSSGFSPETQGLLQAFNVFVTIVMFYFAYISFFQQRDLLSTKLGKSTLALVALAYLSRGVEEFFWFKFSWMIFIPCVLVGAIYVVLFFRCNPKPGQRE